MEKKMWKVQYDDNRKGWKTEWKQKNSDKKKWNKENKKKVGLEEKRKVEIWELWKKS